MHTYVGMIGYCLKDQGEDHFQFCHMNINAQEMQERVNEYVKYGFDLTKKKIFGTQQYHGESYNILQTKNEKENWCYSCRCAFRDVLIWTNLPNIMGCPIQKQWHGVLDITISINYMTSQDVELDDVTRIFYEHANPNSRLKEIGR